MHRRLRRVGIVVVISMGVLWMSASAIACTRVVWNTNKRARVSGRTTDHFIDDEPRW